MTTPPRTPHQQRRHVAVRDVCMAIELAQRELSTAYQALDELEGELPIRAFSGVGAALGVADKALADAAEIAGLAGEPR